MSRIRVHYSIVRCRSCNGDWRPACKVGACHVKRTPCRSEDIAIDVIREGRDCVGSANAGIAMISPPPAAANHERNDGEDTDKHCGHARITGDDSLGLFGDLATEPSVAEMEVAGARLMKVMNVVKMETF